MPRWCWLWLVALALFVPLGGRGETRYKPVYFSELLGSRASAEGINNLGQVVGSYAPVLGVDGGQRYRMFVYDVESGRRLESYGGLIQRAVGINDSGQIVFNATDDLPNGNGRARAFLYDHGKLTDLGTLPGSTNTWAAAINAAGWVVGTVNNSYGERRGFIFRDGRMTDVGSFGGYFTDAYGINGAGNIVGKSTDPMGHFHSYVTQAGEIRDLGSWDSLYNVAHAINDAGQIVGGGSLPDRVESRRAFIYEKDRTVDLGTVGGGLNSEALAINNRGQIVGFSESTFIGVSRGVPYGGGDTAFVYENGRMRDLNRVTDWPEAGGGPTLFGGTAINDRGEIIVYGIMLRPIEEQPSRLVNFSIRTTLAAAGRPVRLGFVTAGASRDILLRGVGPGLAPFGVGDGLADPQLRLFGGDRLLAVSGNQSLAASSVVAARVGAFPLSAGTSDAALVQPLGAGVFNLELAGGNIADGTVLAEIYDTAAEPVGRLLNASALVELKPGATVSAGFVINGDASKFVLVRAVGPTLREFGVSGALERPQIELYDGAGKSVAVNLDWTGGNNFTGRYSLLSEAFFNAGAFPYPDFSKDTAMLVSLPPGAYSVIVSGQNGTAGMTLIEVYEVP